MILKDIINEYKLAYSTLAPCRDYFNEANDLITNYFFDITTATSKYFKLPSVVDTNKNTLINDLTSALSKSYKKITQLVIFSYEFHKAIATLETQKYKNQQLQLLITDFINNSHETIKLTNEIIKVQFPDMKKGMLLASLIIPLQNIVQNYYTLMNLYEQFEETNNMLLEPLPEQIIVSDNYSDISINSNSTVKSFEDMTSSISAFGNIVDLISRLKNNNISEKYYIRKIESGSLVIMITGTTISIMAIMKFIDFCFKKYIELRKAHLEIKTMKQEVIKNDLEIIKTTLEIAGDAPECHELIERATESAFNYFSKNPIFRLNDTLYDTGEETKLLNSNSQ